MKVMLDGALQAEPVRDDYQSGEVLADQVGTGSPLSFTFSAPVNLVVIDASGEDADVARADPFGGTAGSALGIPCRNDTPTFMPVVATTISVWAPTGMTVSCYGYRRL